MDVNLLEDYPVSFNKAEFESIRSFQGKLDYAVKHLKRIASGSARTVFIIDDKKALKIAKNKKGLAQNRVEGDWYLQKYEITAKIFDKDDNNFWLEMELAKKVYPKRFRELTGISIEELKIYLNIRYPENRSFRSYYENKMDENRLSQLDNDDFVIDLTSIMGDFNMPIGDFLRLSSYGEVIRDGKSKIVLVDYGLTREIYDDFYKTK